MKLGTGKKVSLVFAGSQIVLVALGAFQLDPWSRLGSLGKVLAYYSTLSGAGSGYAFFAPGVGSQVRARFEVKVDGNISTETLERGTSHEADLRIGNILGQFSDADRKMQRSLAASWAGKVYGRAPRAEAVTVLLDSYVLPSMKDYREGKRPHWKPYYNATFVKKRKAKLAAGDNRDA